MQLKIERVWHPYVEWEEIEHNMWGDVIDTKMMMECAVEFTGDHLLYGGYMRRVIEEWPVSCENALTDPYLNRKAWIGHAAVALAMGCPEDITRKAWGKLNSEQQHLANLEAIGAIQSWEDNYRANKQLRSDLEGPLLPG